MGELAHAVNIPEGQNSGDVRLLTVTYDKVFGIQGTPG